MEVPGEFSVSVWYLNRFQIVVVRGELDELTAPELDGLLNGERNGRTVIVDLSPLAFISSAGIHVLFRERSTTTVVVCSPGSYVGRLLARVWANQSVAVFDSLDDAIQSLSLSQVASIGAASDDGTISGKAERPPFGRTSRPRT